MPIKRGFLWLMILISSGCATQVRPTAQQDRALLETRIAELESTQARQKAKIDNLEQRLSGLDDLVAMIARRTAQPAREVVRIEPPAANSSPSTSNDDNNNDDEIIISEEKARAYFGRQSASPPPRRYDNVVTNEKLPPSTAPSGAATNPLQNYQSGVDLFRQRKFDEARQSFERFIDEKPLPSYMDNALYWIGECYTGMGLSREALAYYQRVIHDYPQENKVPDALLRIAQSYQALGQRDQTIATLRQLMDAYPSTEAARSAKSDYERLQTHSDGTPSHVLKPGSPQ